MEPNPHYGGYASIMGGILPLWGYTQRMGVYPIMYTSCHGVIPPQWVRIQQTPQSSSPTPICVTRNPNTPLGGVPGGECVHSPLETPHRGVHTPKWGAPTEHSLRNRESQLGSAHSPVGTPNWGMHTPQWDSAILKPKSNNGDQS